MWEMEGGIWGEKNPVLYKSCSYIFCQLQSKELHCKGDNCSMIVENVA